MRYNNRKSFIRINIFALSFGLATMMGNAAHAQIGTDGNGTPIFLPSTSSSYNQTGFNLPTMPAVSGQDVVRGSGGLSCHSAVGSNGPNFDMGLIGSNDMFNRDSVSVYGRITVPLGKRPKRVDCTKLYDLEIARLKMEIQLMRAGAIPGMFNQNPGQTLVTQAPKTDPMVVPTSAETQIVKTETVKSKPNKKTPSTPEATTDKVTPLEDEAKEIIALNSTPTQSLTTEVKTLPEAVLIAPLVIGNAPDVSPTH